MSDMGDDFKALHEHNRAIRAKFGVECPKCRTFQPKRHPTILLPGQRCRVDRYKDPRPDLTDEQWGSA
jgi:hypothetical protein